MLFFSFVSEEIYKPLKGLHMNLWKIVPVLGSFTAKPATVLTLLFRMSWPILQR